MPIAGVLLVFSFLVVPAVVAFLFTRDPARLTVIAWLWARTVKSPNPAFSHVDVPLVSTFVLSTKKGKEHYVQPVIEGDSYRTRQRPGSDNSTTPQRRRN